MVAAKIVGPENICGFEANPHLVEVARENYQANNLAANVTNAVLKNRICWGGEGSRAEFHIHRDYWASSFVKSPNTIETVTVPTLCFEEEVRKFNANCLICDIEGGEIELLELADLRSFDKILMEVHYWAGREAVNRMVKRLIFDGFCINFDLTFGSIVTMHRGLAPK
jgi:FkbM family methyltransferase